MFQSGRYYMHTNSKDVCALVLESLGDFMYEVEWWSLGKIGTPTRVNQEVQEIYMHPNVWHDITEHLHEAKKCN